MGHHVRAGRRAGERGPAALLALIALAPLLAGCSLLGSTNSTVDSPPSMTVTSPVFSVDTSLPPIYTCRGAGHSPPLYWSGAPSPRTKSFAIVVDDAQAPITPYVYWLAFNISPTTTAIPENGLPPGARQAQNSKGTIGYDPPCPEGHRDMYRFTVYALNTRLHVHGTGLRAVWSAIVSHVITSGRLTAKASE